MPVAALPLIQDPPMTDAPHHGVLRRLPAALGALPARLFARWRRARPPAPVPPPAGPSPAAEAVPASSEVTRPAAKPSPASEMTAAVVARMLPGATPQAVADNLPHVLAGLAEFGLTDRTMLLMAIATIAAETASFHPVAEAVSRYNTSPGGHPFDLYDNRRDLGNRGRPDGERYKGRGYVQLTGRDNYARVGAQLGVPLEQQPELANDPQVAGRILAAFLASREARIRAALAADDLRTARRLVNGGSHGLEAFTRAYRAGESALTRPAGK
jgi:peptidoglycan L-alanyl-D-glutamate endopeptidase CwlK